MDDEQEKITNEIVDKIIKSIHGYDSRGVLTALFHCINCVIHGYVAKKNRRRFFLDLSKQFLELSKEYKDNDNV
jgi:hypothetical protein